MKRTCLVLLTLGFALVFTCCGEIAQTNYPLSSWNDGKAKQEIINFVNEVTDETDPNFVKPADRIATFDNDGTLWSEQPYYFQLQFALDRVKEMAADHPEWKNNPLFQAVVDDDIK